MMTTREQVLEYGLSFPDTYQDAPFRDDNWQLVRYRGNKKAFLWTYERDGNLNINVKADPVTTSGPGRSKSFGIAASGARCMVMAITIRRRAPRSQNCDG